VDLTRFNMRASY